MLHLQIKTPGAILLDNEHVSSVTYINTSGKRLMILNNHAPVIAEMREDPFYYVDNEGEKQVLLQPGIVRVRNNAIQIFTDGIISEESELSVDASANEVSTIDRLAEDLIQFFF